MATPITQLLPKTGDTLRCEECGMEFKVQRDCESDREPLLECCGQPLTKSS